MKKFFREFQEFAMKGNVMDMAVGIIIGGAFGKIVSSFVADVIMPPIGLLLGKTHFANLAITLSPATADTAAVTLNYGSFVQTIVDFLLIALSIFIMIRLLNSARRKAEKLEQLGKGLVDNTEKGAAQDATEPAPEPETQEQLLAQIRDMLKSMQPKSYTSMIK